MEKIIELVKLAKSGDKEAYTNLIIEIKEELYKIAKTKISREEDIKDVLQETTLKGYLNISKLRNNKHFKTWIIRILINECNRFYQENNKYNEANNKYFYNITADYKEETSEEIFAFDNLVYVLDNIEKEIFRLYYEEKYTINEIAEMLNINSNTIKTKLNRGRKKIEGVLRKGIVVILVLAILTTGFVVGRSIINYIKEIFDLSTIGQNNDGILEAIENKEWFQNIKMDFIDLENGYSIKPEYLIIDDINMYIVFDLQTQEKSEKYDRFSIIDLKIVDENETVICNEGEVIEDSIVKLTGWKKINQESTKNIKELVYMISDGYHSMNNLTLSFSKIVIYNSKMPTEKKDLDFTEKKINIDLEEKFINREKIEYVTEKEEEEYIVKKAIITDTGFYAIVRVKNENVKFYLKDNGNKYNCSKRLLKRNYECDRFELLVYTDVNSNNDKLLLKCNNKVLELRKKE